ncbi:hypothetical protein AArcSl_0700 [Halalkaliarchaeum desulfuricum]|uniref:Uncharacterized protein n=1 Tax=Halalkaliarchaeum desulfuricum TaxID=2055893 RepID=A0A343TGX7_9EURY|nr:hypothetical protein [Halalkaliarchaeum desulfuricum]AUX08349.1 hypothetical protein AArcSl_0700 [Halalkaliarchaeum desulfuricum]
MNFDLPKTVGAFVLVLVIGIGSLFILPEVTPMAPMTTQTILMMVLPSMVIFGAVMVLIGVKHGEYRAMNV